MNSIDIVTFLSDPRLIVVGATSFGAVVGWMANHVLEGTRKLDITWLGAMISVLAGGSVTALFDPRTQLFAGYCVGLAGAFFIRVVARPVFSWIGKFFDAEAPGARESGKSPVD